MERLFVRCRSPRTPSLLVSPLRWVRLKDLRTLATLVASKEPVDTRPPGSTVPVLDSTFAKSWIERLSAFLEKVKSKGGEALFEIGTATDSKLALPRNVPQPLRVLL